MLGRIRRWLWERQYRKAVKGKRYMFFDPPVTVQQGDMLRVSYGRVVVVRKDGSEQDVSSRVRFRARR